MTSAEKLEGFQTLEQDFFRVCKKLHIRGDAQLLLIYLRGLHCRFRRSDIYRADSTITDEMGISYSSLRRARKFLQSRQVIDYKSSPGRHSATVYLILKTDLAPVIKLSKKNTLTIQNEHIKPQFLITKCIQNEHPRSIKIKEEKRSCVFSGMTKEQKEALDSGDFHRILNHI